MDFVVFSDDWARHPSSCQHLFAQLTKNHRALWVNTIGMRAPKVDSFTAGRSLEKLQQWARPLQRVSDNLHVYSPAMLPIGGKSAAARMNASICAARIRSVYRRLGFRNPVLFTSIPTAADYVGLLDESALVYYITDNYQLWPGGSPEVIASQDKKLKIAADLLLPVGDELGKDLEKCSQRVVKMRHAVDIDHFKQFDNLEEPEDLQKIPGPRACFFGLIYEKIDLELLEKCALANPDKSLVMIGPVKCDVSRLEKLSNVFFLGAKDYKELPHYLSACDTLLLAYKLDDQTRQNAPLKIRECLAAGKSVIATSIDDLNQYSHLINLADSEQEFIELFSQAGHLPCDRPAMRAAVQTDSWQARATELEQVLSQTIADKNIHLFTKALEVDLCDDISELNDFVYSKPDVSIFQDARWTKVMSKAYGLRMWNIICRKDGQISGYLPIVQQKSFSFGHHLVSLPWLDHAGAVAADSEANAALLGRALKIANDLDCDLQVRSGDHTGETIHPAYSHSRTDKVAMVLELPDDSEILWKSFKAKVRNQVRKAEKSGLTSRWAGAAELMEFYDIYSRNMRDLGSPPHSMEFFEQIFEQFAGQTRLMLVDNGNSCIAAALVLTDANQWQVPWASSLREFNSFCPNHLMYWTILKNACSQAKSFSFGRSSRDSGTYKFKAQWGSTECQLNWEYYLSDSSYDGRPSRFAKIISNAWRRLPVSVAKKVGPSIIRSVP